MLHQEGMDSEEAERRVEQVNSDMQAIIGALTSLLDNCGHMSTLSEHCLNT